MRNGALARSIWKLVQSPAVIFLTALSMRLWAASRLSPDKAWRYFYGYNEFARIAWAMVSGHGYSSPWPNTPLLPTAVEPPVYTVLLFGIFKIGGAYSFTSLWIAIALNAVFSSITAVLLLRVGQSTFGSPVGILAAWVWSCWVYEAVVSVRLWESSLSALVLFVGLLWLPELGRNLRPVSWAGFGALAGVGALTNTSLIAVFPFFLVWLFIQHRRQKRFCGLPLVTAIIICILVMLPWTIRNYMTFHRWMPVRDNFGLELWLGNHEGVGSQFETFPIVNPEEYNRLGEIRFMETEREIALQFIRQHPLQFLGRCARHVFRYWSEPRGSAWPLVSFLAWVALGLALHRRQQELIPHGIVMLCFPVAYYITHTFPTYRHVIEPSVLLMASYAVVSAGLALATRMRQGRPERGSVGPPFLNVSSHKSALVDSV